MIAAPSRPLLDIVIEQNRRLAALDDNKNQRAERAVSTLVEQIAPHPRPEHRSGDQDRAGPCRVAYWLASWSIRSPMRRPMRCRCAGVAGARDIQVDAVGKRWRAFHDDPKVTFSCTERSTTSASPARATAASLRQRPSHGDPALIDDTAAGSRRTEGRTPGHERAPSTTPASPPACSGPLVALGALLPLSRGWRPGLADRDVPARASFSWWSSRRRARGLGLAARWNCATLRGDAGNCPGTSWLPAAAAACGCRARHRRRARCWRAAAWRWPHSHRRIVGGNG